jgi:predicted nucleic acid-binding protein
MILIDTNVVVGLVDERDELHSRAKKDIESLVGPFSVTSVVLAEAHFLMPEPHLRARLRHLLERLPISVVELAGTAWPSLFDWLERFAEHEPDLCDGQLCVLASERDASIWTYDREFQTLWRTPDGKPVRIVPTQPQRQRKRRTRRHA